MYFPILKFDCYPNVIAWLDHNSGLAVKGEQSFLEVTSTHLLCSALLPESVVLQTLEHFPSATKISLGLTADGAIAHPTYLVHETRAAIVERLRQLGHTTKKAACYMQSSSEQTDLIELMSEFRLRAGGNLAKLPYEELGKIYRSFNE
jgi:hypothetical protein